MPKAVAIRARLEGKRPRISVTRGLLCVDPGAPRPTIRAYNARFDLTSRTGKLQQYQYARSDGAMSRVAMTEAIALHLKTER
jgi:hypothetical protein